MITIAFNEENEEDQEEQINSSSEKINAEPIKEKLDNGKEKVKSKLKDKKVIKFIASHISNVNYTCNYYFNNSNYWAICFLYYNARNVIRKSKRIWSRCMV